MDLIDFILNIAALLLWLTWRSLRSDAVARATPATLAGTVRRTEPMRLQRWHLLAGLGGLLVGRAIFYRLVGPEVNWAPRLDLFYVLLPFRPDHFASALLFSALSFARILIVFYSWLLFLSWLNHRAAEGDPYQKAIQLQLDRVARWPRYVRLILPLLAIPVLWIALHPLLVHFGVVNRVRMVVLIEQSLLIGTAVCFSLKYLLPAILLIHLIASYVFFGNSPLWDFVSMTARNLLAPLSRLPLRLGRVDLAPVIGIILILLLLHALPIVALDVLDRRNLTIWPQ